MSIDPVPRRILLALDSMQDLMALEAATEMASLLRATLQGVFVENIELLRLAQLPFAREVSLVSASARRLESAQLERDLRAQAEQMRRLLERRAATLSLTWSFRVERGAVATTLADDGTLDVVVLGRSYGHGAPQQRPGGNVLVTFDGSEESLRALDVAATMATPDGELLVLLAGPDVPRLRPQAAAHLAQRRITSHYVSLPELSPAQLLAAGKRYHCRMLVVSGGGLRTPQALQQLLQKSTCPVVLAR